MLTNARVFQPEFVPSDVVQRDAELNTISAALNPLTHGGHPETVMLYGPSGTGKTCIAQFILERLATEVGSIDTQYVNCWKDYSRFKTLYRLLDGIDRSLNVHRQSTPKDELLERLEANTDAPYVVILDEADQLDDVSVLYDLYRIPNLHFILIANREEALFSRLNQRLTSRLHTGIRIQCDPYSPDALVAILEDRVRYGMEIGVVTNEQLYRLADAAGGDARVAITSLRAAAQQAVQVGADTITDAALDAAIPEAKRQIRQTNVEQLTEHQQAVYDVIEERGEVEPHELYEAYRERVEEPKCDRTVRNYIKKMRHYNLVAARGENRGRTYRIVSDG